MLALLAVTALVALLHRHVVFRGQVYYFRDIHLQWIVQAETFVRCFKAGSWPVWNPYVSFGEAFLANPNAEVFYPLTWLNLLLTPPTYYTVFVVTHFLLSGIGMLLLARRLGLTWPASVVAASVWLAGGPFASLVNLWNHLAGAAWMPWSALAADRALSSGRLRDAVGWGAAVAAALLAGSPETVAMAALASAAIAARHRRAHPARRQVAVVAAAALLALGLSAAQWVPSLEMARRSVRSVMLEAHVTLWSVPPRLLWQVFAPVFLDRVPLRFEVRTALFDGREPFLASLYLGLAASGLVLAAVLEGRRLPRALLLLAAAGVVVALGRHAPVHHLLTAAIPPLRTLRFPAKAMILAGFLWAVLAGMGVDALARAQGWRMSVVRVWLAVAAMVAAVGALLVRLQTAAYAPAVIAEEFRRRSLDVVVQPASHNLLAAAVAAAALAGLAGRFAPHATRAWGLLVAVVVAGDLAFAHRDLHGTADPELLRFRPEALRTLADRPPLSRVYSYDYLDPRGQLYLGHAGYVLKLLPDQWPVVWADAAALRTALYPSVLGYWGVETAYTIDALGLYSQPLALLTTLLRIEEQTPLELRLLQMGAVSRVVALHAQGFEDLKPVGEMPGLFVEPIRVFAVPDPLPRVYAVEGVRVADSAEAVRAITDPLFDPRREVVLAEGSAVAARDGFTASTQVAEWRPDRLAVDVELDRPGHLVLVDTYDPGWKATVDGAPATVARANLAFRAVPVPAGRHRVAMAYRPASIRIGLAVSGLALAVAGLLLLVRPRSGA